MLAIEISNPSAWDGKDGLSVRPGVAVVEQDSGDSVSRPPRILGIEEIDPTHQREDDLVAAIDRLMRRLGLGARDLGSVAVSAGPGGFTAIRMAVTVAKTIADVAQIPCVPIPTANSVARAMVGDGQGPRVVDASFAVALASKGETAWVACFSAEGEEIDPGTLRDAGGLAGVTRVHSCAALVCDRFIPAAMEQGVTAQGLQIIRPIFDPVACASAASGVKGLDAAAVVPIYPREAEAVRKWREQHAAKGGS